MPVVQDAPIEITAFSWVPDFAKGVVRDMRARWALEEAGLPYRVRLYDAREPRPQVYFREQPFGQVPALREGGLQMFESAAIVLHIGERSEALLPRDAVGRARAVTWVLCAINSVENVMDPLIDIDIFSAGENWTRERRPAAEEAVRARLKLLSEALGSREWFEDRFTAGDLMMTMALRALRHTSLVEEHDNLAAFRARCEARPAFVQALADHMAAFETRAAA
ncbi:glutathione S-transferase family protein [Methylopila sp. M107]|uniref:glutathione S-transferase family protein n=1 Tax=Methylopila sp. M107 TaxID=1101190 RepID=UPI00037646BE|nr:glutathione S-transferase family protein [Methylopila sp. M107]